MQAAVCVCSFQEQPGPGEAVRVVAVTAMMVMKTMTESQVSADFPSDLCPSNTSVFCLFEDFWLLLG